MVEEDVKEPAYTAMPCGFEEEFVDFESAAHDYSISSCATDEWAISELDDEALGIGGRTVGSGSGGNKTTTTLTGWGVYSSFSFLLRILCFHSCSWGIVHCFACS